MKSPGLGALGAGTAAGQSRPTLRAKISAAELPRPTEPRHLWSFPKTHSNQCLIALRWAASPAAPQGEGLYQNNH